MDSILICTRLLVNQKAPCQRSTTCRGIQLRDTLTVVLQIKQIQRRYEQPYEFSEFPWYILRHIFLTAKSTFQLPAFPTANQILWHCSNSQSALRPKSGRNEHKRERVCARPNFSGGRQRECIRTAKTGPDLRLCPSSIHVLRVQELINLGFSEMLNFPACKSHCKTLYQLSVILLTKSLELILEISAIYRSADN